MRMRTGVRRELAARVDMNVLRWFGHVERMDNERLLKKVMNAKVDGRSARGRPRLRRMDGVKRALNHRRMDMREASERARNRNEVANDCDAVLIGICCCHGAVGEMASMKRHKLWKTGADGLCCSSSAIQTWLGPSSLLDERSNNPIAFVVSLCCRLSPKLGETAKVYR